MFMALYADLGECMMKRRKTGTAQVKVKMDANGRLVQLGGDREAVKDKPSSRHGSGVGAG